MKDIRNFDTFVKIESIHKGWSGDRKYYLETKDGERFLLRVSDISSYETKQHEFEIMKKISAAGIKMSLPISFGICEEGKSVYLLLSWCDGEEAKEALYHLSDAEQYVFGRKAANVLKQMEAIDYKPPSQEWSQTYQGRVAHYIELYRRCGYTFDGDDVIISFLRTQRHCIGERPTALMHEDFQTDNMVISSDGELYMIDFQMCGETDPYLVMTGAGVSAMYSVPFAMGQIDGYFGKTVPEDFWQKYRYYMLAEMLYAFTVGVKMEEEREETLHMFDNEIKRIKYQGSPIPMWYQKKFCYGKDE
ncbi:MAG: phosphotransferase [Lachnospiraceae bacterium]|nr:phosphotransferase [Lachnospiraceae bacterium]